MSQSPESDERSVAAAEARSTGSARFIRVPSRAGLPLCWTASLALHAAAMAMGAVLIVGPTFVPARAGVDEEPTFTIRLRASEMGSSSPSRFVEQACAPREDAIPPPIVPDVVPLLEPVRVPTQPVAERTDRAVEEPVVAESASERAPLATGSASSSASGAATTSSPIPAASGAGNGGLSAGANPVASSGSGAPGNGAGSHGSGDGLGGPVLVFGPQPDYPESAVRRGEEGGVLCAIHVGESGDVGSVEVLATSGHARLDDAAVQTLRRWRFRPATKDGRPIATRVVHRVEFKLD